MKLITGNMARGSAPHAQDDVKAQSQFDQFTADGLELLTNAITVGETVEGEIYAKIAYVILGQQMTDLFNPNIQARADIKRLRVLTMVSLAMTGRPIFKDLRESAGGMDVGAAEAWFADCVAKGYTVLNRLENWFKRGVKVAMLCKKQKGGLVVCFQSASNHKNLLAFMAFAAPMVETVLNEIKAAKKEGDAKEKDIVATAQKYLGDKAFTSNQIADLIAYMNGLHSQAVTMEAAAAARAAAADVGEEEEEEEMELAA